MATARKTHEEIQVTLEMNREEAEHVFALVGAVQYRNEPTPTRRVYDALAGVLREGSSRVLAKYRVRPFHSDRSATLVVEPR